MQVDTKLRLQWVENFEYVTRELAQPRAVPEWASFGIFWIRLHGVLVDIRETFDRWARLPVAEFPTSPLCQAQNIHRLILAVRDSLTEDEVIWADYRRQTEAHVRQSGYRLNRKKKGTDVQVHDTYEVKALKKTYDVDDLDDRLGRVFRRHMNERKLAIDFAKRIQAPAMDLAKAFRKFHSAEQRDGPLSSPSPSPR